MLQSVPSSEQHHARGLCKYTLHGYLPWPPMRKLNAHVQLDPHALCMSHAAGHLAHASTVHKLNRFHDGASQPYLVPCGPVLFHHALAESGTAECCGQVLSLSIRHPYAT